MLVIVRSRHDSGSTKVYHMEDCDVCLENCIFDLEILTLSACRRRSHLVRGGDTIYGQEADGLQSVCRKTSQAARCMYDN